MESRAYALAAGLFALLLGTACVLAVWWFSGSRDEMRTYELVSTGIISGLNEQAHVRYRGMAAGKVTSIRIDPDDPRNLLITVRVRADLPVTRGTRASLGYQGVTGLAFVQLDDRGKDPAPLTGEGDRPPRLVLEGGVLEQITDTAVEAITRFGRLSDQVAAFFDERNLRRLQDALEAIESAANSVDSTFVDAPATLAAIRSAFTPENLDSLARMLAKLEQASGEAGPVLVEMRRLMERTDRLLLTLDGAAHAASSALVDETLPEFNRLARELRETSVGLRRLVDEIEAAPQLLVTGRGAPHPGPGEPGFEPVRR
jgi:phospholipid/cholesterol/gamma-HCH transport system substrate-binding protein